MIGRFSSLSAAFLLSVSAHATPAGPLTVNPTLVAHHAQFKRPTLLKVSPGVFAAVNYDLSNFVFIEGKTGIIVIDTGWFQGPFEQAFTDLRKRTDKPVVAVIYTHAHGDHTGGGAYAVQQGSGAVPVYAPSGFGHAKAAKEGPAQAIIEKRSYQQLGFGLPGIGIDPVGGGVGPAVPVGKRAVAPATILIDKTGPVTIDGVDLELIRTGADLPEALMVWMPGRKLLVAGDIVSGVFPPVKTPRYQPERNPADMLGALDLALKYAPDIVLPGHGRMLLTPADAKEVMTLNRDAIQYLIDQVDRGIANGLSREQIAHIVTLPAALARHPDLQPFYHRREWILRAMVNDKIGFFDSHIELFRHDGVEEAHRVVALAGGAAAMRASAAKALADDDPRWALRLVDFLQLAGDKDAEVGALHLASLQKLAAITDNMNEHHYALSEKAMIEGRIDGTKAVAPQVMAFGGQLPNVALLREWGARLKAEMVGGQELALGVEIPGDPLRYSLQLRNDVLRLETGEEAAKATLIVPREVLLLLRARQLDFPEMMTRADVSVRGERKVADRIFALME